MLPDVIKTTDLEDINVATRDGSESSVYYAQSTDGSLSGRPSYRFTNGVTKNSICRTATVVTIPTPTEGDPGAFVKVDIIVNRKTVVPVLTTRAALKAACSLISGPSSANNIPDGVTDLSQSIAEGIV